MSSSTPIDGARRVKRPRAVPTLAAIGLATAAGCSRVHEISEQDGQAAKANPVSTQARAARSLANAPPVVDRSTARAAGDEAGSRILGKKDFTLRGAPACEIRFVYAGRGAENLFWEEPCPAVTAKMMTRRDLEAFGKWKRLDGFGRKFVEALPGGKVLYVEGRFSASVYPVGTTGATYEAAVAD